MPRNWNDDPYTKKARKEGYEARSAFKLEEIDKREQITRGAKNILDLGAAPGSWTQYCLRHLSQAKIWAIDLQELNVEDPRLTFVQASIYDHDLKAWLGDQKMDLLLSDMAPKTTGMHDADVAASLELCAQALTVAKDFLKPGGNFVVKVFMGADFETYHKQVKAHFQSTRLLRPDSTRKHSREIFLTGKGFKK